MRTVNTLLDQLQDHGLVSVPGTPSAPPATMTVPCVRFALDDEREIIIREMLETERKYVRDLEVLEVRHIPVPLNRRSRIGAVAPF